MRAIIQVSAILTPRASFSSAADPRFGCRSFSFRAAVLRAAVARACGAGSANAPPSAAQQTNPAPPSGQAPSPAPSGPIIVVNPAHGGTDTGARGQDGTIEKDIVLQFARALRAELDRQGFHAVLTRNDDSNPSYDDRAAAVNAYRDAIFVSLHVSSTGTFGTVRTYYEQMPPVAIAAASDSDAPVASSSPGGLVAWSEAQRAYLAASHRLATLVQIQCAQSFTGSSVAAQQAPIRELRSIEAPGIAVELSNVAGDDSGALLGKATPLATAIARGIQAFRADRGK